MLAVKCVVKTSVETIFVERRRNNCCGLRTQVGYKRQFCECLRLFRKRGLLTLALKGEKGKHFVLLNRPANGAAEELPLVGRIGLGSGAIAIRLCLVSIESLFAEECECRAVEIVGTRLCDHVDRGA